MPIKITRADEPIKVEQIVACIYAPPGLGKSTLGFSADAPLLLDFDKGAYRAANRGDSVQVSTWEDVKNISADDLKDYKTVVVDTAGRALDVLSVDIIARNPKMGRGGALSLQGYGQLKSEFAAWIKLVRSMGKDIVLIAHSQEEKNGDDMVERLDVQGGSKGEIYKSADAMGRLSLVNGKRILNFSPSDTAFGKNPGQLKPITVPEIATEPNFLGGVIAGIKEKLNELSEVQIKRQSAIADWLAKIEDSVTSDDFNNLVKEAKQADSSISSIVKGAIHKKATGLSFVFDAKEGYKVPA